MYKSSLLTLLLIAIHSIAITQTLPDSLTPAHQLVEGTKIYLVPPPGFEASGNFKGFQNPEDPTSMIMVMEMPASYGEASKGFNAEQLRPRGMDLLSRKEIETNYGNGLLLEIDQFANGMQFSKHLLILGDESSTTLVNGVFLKDATDVGEAIKKSVLSLYSNQDMDVNPRDALSYTVDETTGGLQFHSVIGNAILMNRDLKTPTESEDMVNLVVDKSYAKVEIEDKKAFCLKRLATYPGNYSLNSEKGIQEVELDGLSGYALFGIDEEDETMEAYQLILFEEPAGYFLFFSTYLRESDAFEDVNKIIQTFKRKQ